MVSNSFVKISFSEIFAAMRFCAKDVLFKVGDLSGASAANCKFLQGFFPLPSYISPISTSELTLTFVVNDVEV